jgi:hypothetical protein
LLEVDSYKKMLGVDIGASPLKTLGLLG